MLPKIIVGAVTLLVSLFAWKTLVSPYKSLPASLQSGQNESDQTPQQKEQPSVIPGRNKPFYSKDGIYLVHSWPGDQHFSNEETEILVLNESGSNIEVRSFDLIYSVEGKTYPHKSGTWEKFPSRESWDRTEYLNIGKSYYQNQPLILSKGEKGKLHWHINFSPSPLDGKQTVKVKLSLLRDGQSIPIDQEFTRPSGPVFSKDEH